MKMMFGALALSLAAPVAAQAAPAADPHGAHKQGRPQHEDQKQDMDCCKMPCCEKMKRSTKGEKKSCCAEEGKAPAGPHKGH